jgi:hypothetical protein
MEKIQDAPQLMNGPKKCGIYIQCSFTQPQRRMKFFHSLVRVALENNILSKVSWPRWPKIACSPSYADYRPKTNAIILQGMAQTLRVEHP